MLKVRVTIIYPPEGDQFIKRGNFAKQQKSRNPQCGMSQRQCCVAFIGSMMINGSR